MTLNEYTNNLKALRGILAKEFPSFVEFIIARNAIRMIKTRITTDGISADGSSFTPYSTTPTLIGATSFTSEEAGDKILGSKKKRKELDWVTLGDKKRLAVFPQGYKGIREAEGRQTKHKDFDRTSEMWKSIKPIRGWANQGHYFVEIGSKVPLSVQKLEGNTEREGKPILDLSKKEEQILTQKTMDFILKKFGEKGVL